VNGIWQSRPHFLGHWIASVSGKIVSGPAILALSASFAPEPDRAFFFAQTCFHRLKTPADSSKEIMKQQLLDSIAVKTVDLM
jgi:hypothetical protein